MKEEITYCGKQAIVACDENCKKAWGINNRPKVYVGDEEEEPDDYYFLPDDELTDAPDHPGTWEGGDAKPQDGDKIPNKWCVRECERCCMVDKGEEIVLPDYTKNHYNIIQKNEEQ